MTVPGWFYDLFMAPLDALGLAALRRRLLEGLSGRVLELGAGTGRNARLAVARAVAVDRDLGFLRRARSQGAGTALVCADARALPFRPGVFDAVVESLVFCSVAEPARALGEIRRVLRPGGELRMLDHVLAPGRLGRLQRALAPAWLRVTGECHLDRDLAAALAAEGVRVERREQRLGGAVEQVHGRF